MEQRSETIIRERQCQKEKDSQALAKGTKRIYIPIERDKYMEILPEGDAFRAYVDSMIAQYPELFPSAIAEGYKLHGLLPESKKMPGIRLRRIKTKGTEEGTEEAYTICPSFVMPYMTGYADDVEKALFLRKFDVPYWALVHVLGRDEMYWYRIECQIGRNSIVGTTVREPDHLPKDLLADEKHTRLNGEKVYVSTTVGSECVLGASVALDAGGDGLEEAYGHFKKETRDGSLRCEIGEIFVG